MYQITKEFAFEAAHRLEGLPEGHQCSRPHGHSYRVQLVLEAGELAPPGFVVDYGDLAPFAEWVRATLDHRDLNDVFVGPTTAENIAWEIDVHVRSAWPAWPLAEVRVSETAKTWASYRRPE